VVTVTLGHVTTKERLHKLVDELSEQEAGDALRYIERRHEDPMVVAFRNAPIDDEPITPSEEEALAGADRDIAAGRTVSLDDLKRELGDE
jgi:hypothetical protein